MNKERQIKVKNGENGWGVSPCGAICDECPRFPNDCIGCKMIKGKVFWTQYIKEEVCAVYDCCVNRKKYVDCGSCEKLPCEKFTADPTLSEAENAANLKKMVSRLKNKKTSSRI